MYSQGAKISYGYTPAPHLHHQLLAGRRGQLGHTSPKINPTNDADTGPEARLFDQFCSANTFQGIMSTFQELCDLLELNPSDHRNFYRQLKSKVQSWKAKSLWAKLDKRASHREYCKQQACANTRVLIIGSGPVGMRMAAEVAFMGGKAVILEKRDRFSRNNVLHLWPYVIHDLKSLGAKKFFGKFCAGAIDHISIRALQCILMKLCLILGVEIHCNVAFEGLVEPESQETGWRAKLEPADHPVSEYEFDVLIGADGKRNTLKGFRRKEFRGKLAIAITANFINRNTQSEARVEEISGVAFIFNQKFFKDLNHKAGIDLENIVYYKDETHYFVMTAKKHSLLQKGVLIWDYSDTAMLLSKENVNQEALLSYAREAADFSTNFQLPNLDFAHNHYGQPDVAMFDFTSMFAAEHASKVLERKGHKLLMGLVGDSLLEPFWPTGSGCARGFLGAMDAAWMIKSWASCKMTPLEVMAERESIYQMLSQTTPENLHKTYNQYTIDPNTRYPNLNTQHFKIHQVRHQYDGDDTKYLNEIVQISEQKSKRYELIRDSHYLLRWFQRQLEPYKSTVKVVDLTTSWRNGLALCCLIHKYRPELIEIKTLDGSEVSKNNQLVFDIAEKEFGILPVMSGQDMAMCEVPDKLTLISYLSQFYEYFRKESIRPAKIARTPETTRPFDKKARRSKSPGAKLSALSKLHGRIQHRREEEMENGDRGKRGTTFTQSYARKRMKANTAEIHDGIVLQNYSRFEGGEPPPKDEDEAELRKKRFLKKMPEPGVRGQNKVSALAKDLAHKFKAEDAPDEKKAEKPAPAKPLIMGQAAPADICYFCRERVYLVERHSAEGIFFHRGCLRCEFCATSLRLGQYAFQRDQNGEAKFYCFQHLGLRKPQRGSRKRSIEKHLPRLSDEPPLAMDLLGAPAPPDSVLNKTPERIEYHTESEMEESELDQTAHNLSASLLDLQGFDSDSSSSDDEVFAVEGEDPQLSDGDVTWTQIARTYRRHLRPKKKRGKKTEVKNGEKEDSDTARESDEEWTTESETEKESEGESEEEDFEKRREKARAAVKALIIPEKIKEPEKKPSPSVEAIHRNRMAFFSVPTEPVRINAKSFLGLQTPKDVTPEREEAQPIPEEPEEEKTEETEEVKEVKEESESSSDYDNVEKDEETITEGSDSEADNSGYVKAIKNIPAIEIVEVEGSTQDSEDSAMMEEEMLEEEEDRQDLDAEQTDSQLTEIEKNEDSIVTDSQVTEEESVKRQSEKEALQRIEALLQDSGKQSEGDTEEDVEDLDLQEELDKIDLKMELMRQTVSAMVTEDGRTINVAALEEDEESDGCYIPESSTLTENMAAILQDDQPPHTSQSPPQIAQSPPHISQFPPQISQSPPQISQSPPRMTPSPPPISQSPPQIAQSPPHFTDLSPQSDIIKPAPFEAKPQEVDLASYEAKPPPIEIAKPIASEAQASKLSGFDEPLDAFSPQPSNTAFILTPSQPLIDLGDSPPKKTSADLMEDFQEPKAEKSELTEKTIENLSVADLMETFHVQQQNEEPEKQMEDSSSQPILDLEDRLQELTDAAMCEQLTGLLMDDSLTEPVKLHEGLEDLVLLDSSDLLENADVTVDMTSLRPSDITTDLLGDETCDNVDDLVKDNEAVSVSVLNDTISQEVEAQRSAFTAPSQKAKPPKQEWTSAFVKPVPKKASPPVQSPSSSRSSSSVHRSPPSFTSPKFISDIPSPPIINTSIPLSSYTTSVLTAGTRQATGPSKQPATSPLAGLSAYQKLKLKIDNTPHEFQKEKSITPELEEELIVKTSNIKSDIKAKALLLLQKPGPLHNPVFDSQAAAAAEKRPSRPAVRKVHSFNTDESPSSYKSKYRRLPPLPTDVTSPPTFTTSPPMLVQAPITKTITPVTQAKSRMLFTEKPKPTKIVPSAGSAFSPVRSTHEPSPAKSEDLNTSKQEDALKRIDNLLDSLKERKTLPRQVEDMDYSEADGTPSQEGDHEHRVKVSADRDGEQEFILDEKFITTRDRRRPKKRIPSGHSETNVTPSSGSSVKSASSSNADMDSTGHSLGDTLNEVDSIDILIASDRETSVSLEGLLDANTYDDDSSARKVKSETALLVTPADQSNIINDSVQDSSNSQYFTPNTSTLEPMDLSLDLARNSSRASQLSEPKSIGSDRSSPLTSPRRNMVDKKRQFFFDSTKPVHIDAKKLFPELKTPDGKVKKIVESPKKVPIKEKENVEPVENGVDCARKGDADKMREWKSFEGAIDSPTKVKLSDVDNKRDWQSFDNDLLASPTDTAGPGDDVFATPATSIKPKSDSVFKRPTEPVRKRLLPELPSEKSKVDLNNKVLTAEEIKMLKEVERSQARQQARERARLLSDEELGIPVRKGSLKATQSADELDTDRSVSESHSIMSDPEKSISRLDSQRSEPSSSHDYYRQVSSEPESVFGSTESATSDKSKKLDKPKRFKLKAPEKDKVKADSKRERKESGEKEKGEKKEKRRSLLALFMPSKSVEKKEKEKEMKSPKIKEKEDQEKDKTASDKKLGVKLRSKLKPQKSAEKEEEKEKRASSVYDEFVPFFEDISGEDLDKNRSSFRERLEQVAPNQPKSASKIAPKAQVEDFDTESEMGDDRVSLRSFQSAGQMSEEDMSRYRRKQEKIAIRKQREQEMKRLRMAQEIQRHLEEVEFKQKEVETRGIAIERALRGEGPEASRNESELMQEWFNVVHEKNALVRYESELMVQARELELQDRHSRLENDLRDLMNIEEHNKSTEQKEEEQRILEELLEVVEQRDALVALLEEDRLKEREKDQDLSSMMATRGLQLSPIPLSS